MLLVDYFLKEIETYKKGQVRQVTYNKYCSNGRFLIKNFPDLVLSKMTADDYQQVLNKYAETHEKATTTDFHHQLAWALNDIDFKRKTVSINKTLAYKGNRKGTRAFAPTKNKYSVRTIIVDDTVLYMLWKNARGADPDESIFYRLKGFQFNSTLNNNLKRACRKAGVPEITLHSLRHEHATYLVSQGISSMAVAERLGHADDSVTRAVYIHRLETEKARDDKEIAQKIASL